MLPLDYTSRAMLEMPIAIRDFSQHLIECNNQLPLNLGQDELRLLMADFSKVRVHTIKPVNYPRYSRIEEVACTLL